MSSSGGREMEKETASDCTFGSATLRPVADQPWTIVQDSTTTPQMDSDIPCTILDPSTTMKVFPIQQQYGGWDDVHFHSSLRLPLECSMGNGVVVLLEAMARECVAVALSPKAYYDMGKTYVVHLGASGNVSTVVRRHINGTEAIDVTLPSRVCHERSYVPYWICLTSGVVYVGMGHVPGQNCIGRLDDSLYNQLRSPVDAVRFVGIGNSALGRQARPVKVRNVAVTTVPTFLADLLKGLPVDMPFISAEAYLNRVTAEGGGGVAADDEETQAMLKEYQEECRKQKARAAKFGIPYKEPSPQAFLKWSQARRLRANPEKGFITGLDVMSPEEISKQEARKARFGLVDKRKHTATDGEEEEQDGGNNNMEEGGEDNHAMDQDEKPPLDIVQAWENHELVQKHRHDPPAKLWMNPPPEGEDLEESREGVVDDDFAMEPKPDPMFIPEKIHICSIDWAAFKQIRTDDIMVYFKNYGPSYVEWLGELSCNILFEDKYSAARALHNMSQELPIPPPTEILAPTQTATSDAPVKEEVVPAAVAEGGEEAEMNIAKEEEHGEPQGENAGATDAKSPPPDLGNMGWKFCKQPIRKVHNDRYGRRGTTARILLRVATNADILTDRPTSWPKPPPGFTTKRVLGPGSDFDSQPRRKKRRKNHRRDDNRGANNKGDDGNPTAYDFASGSGLPAMDRGLSSGRDGFSVEELEAERAAKLETAPPPQHKSEDGTETREDVEE